MAALPGILTKTILSRDTRRRVAMGFTVLAMQAIPIRQPTCTATQCTLATAAFTVPGIIVNAITPMAFTMVARRYELVAVVADRRSRAAIAALGVEPVVSPYEASRCEALQYEAPLYNVEPAGVSILGSIPVEGSGLLTQADLFPMGAPGGGQLPQLPQAQGVLQQLQNLPTLNLPPFSQ